MKYCKHCWNNINGNHCYNSEHAKTRRYCLTRYYIMDIEEKVKELKKGNEHNEAI